MGIDTVVGHNLKGCPETRSGQPWVHRKSGLYWCTMTGVPVIPKNTRKPNVEFLTRLEDAFLQVHRRPNVQFKTCAAQV